MSGEHGGISHGYSGMSGERCWAEHGGHPVCAVYIDIHSIGCGDYVCDLFLDLFITAPHVVFEDLSPFLDGGYCSMQGAYL